MSKQAEPLRFEFMRFLGLVIAMAWTEFLNSPFDEVFYPGGQRIRVRVERYISKDDTRPTSVSEIMSDRSADA